MPEEWGFSLFDARHMTMSDCRNCGYNFFDPAEHIIGFTSYPPCKSSAITEEEGEAGSIVLDCPQCQSKWWIHIDQEDLKLYEKKCPRWPKDKD